MEGQTFAQYKECSAHGPDRPDDVQTIRTPHEHLILRALMGERRTEVRGSNPTHSVNPP